MRGGGAFPGLVTSQLLEFALFFPPPLSLPARVGFVFLHHVSIPCSCFNPLRPYLSPLQPRPSVDAVKSPGAGWFADPAGGERLPAMAARQRHRPATTSGKTARGAEKPPVTARFELCAVLLVGGW